MFNYLYGPVSSWRLGASLGIDLLSQKEKLCTFDCAYCQLGATQQFSSERKIFVPSEKIIKELQQIPPETSIDFYTFAGKGEPTLACNFPEIADYIKDSKKGKTAILTNSTLIIQKEVQNDLLHIDFAAFKIDAAREETFHRINRPMPGIELAKILSSLKEFRPSFSGMFVIQVMATTENISEMKEIREICVSLEPTLIQISTPIRNSPVPPLSPEQMDSIEEIFQGLPVQTVYHGQKKKVVPFSSSATFLRRGKENIK
ncbi:MAG: radical SAM protein [Candidatus Ratteibacteria bacterium]|jgi:wyosine [tRNA(Phe)-imidazoG37] synthetase (radical SAM superfamily)